MSPVRYDYTGESLCSWIQRHVWFGEMFTASEHVMNLDARLNLGKIKHVRTKEDCAHYWSRRQDESYLAELLLEKG